MITEQVNISAQSQSFDLDMELLNPAKIHTLGAKSVKIIGTEKNRKHAAYKIQVSIGDCSWTVRKRYRDFYSLHEELVVTHGLPWDLLPPKKFIGNMSDDHIEKRRLALEKYLQMVLSVLFDMPNEVIEFLEFDRFDVNSVCYKLAKDLYEIGDSILDNDEVFTISPLQIHCINRRLLLPLPTCDTGDPTEDIGHLYAFINQAKHIKVQSKGQDNTFIGDSDLTYDLSIFKSLETLILNGCDLELLNGLESIQNQLWELRVIRSLKFVKDILITSWNQGVLVEVDDGEQRIAASLPTWDNIVFAAFTHDELTSIDSTITLLPNIRKLDLSHNLLTDVQYLESFLYLRELDLSYNEITDVEDFPYKLGAITTLNLSGNRLRDVRGLDKMFSLKNLKISDNLIEKMSSILRLGNLPFLENVDLHGNACTQEQFYNVRLIAQFGERYKNVTVDGVPTCKGDLAKALEIINMQNSYEVISGPENYYRPGITATSREAEPVKQVTPPRSPRVRPSRVSKKHHIADIKPAPSSQKNPNQLTAVEKEEANFRDKIEKLREQAGESWLTFYNELQVEEEGDTSEKKLDANTRAKKVEERITQEVNETTKAEEKTQKPVNKVKPVQSVKDSHHPQDDSKTMLRKVVENIVKEDNYEYKIPGAVINILEDMLDQNFDLMNETFLIFKDNEKTGLYEEHILSLDTEENALLEIELISGMTVAQYHLDKIRNVRIRKIDLDYWIYFDQEESNKEKDEKGVWLEIKFKFQGSKDCAGLFALLVANTRIDENENLSSNEETSEEKPMHVVSPIDNPFLLKNEILLSFFQEFVQKTSAIRKDPEVKQRQHRDSYNSLVYQNIGIGAPFLKHTVPKDVTQDVILILWAGCLPYLFPEEELPTCLVMTNYNIFLFRVFLPEDTSTNSLPKTAKEMKEIFHCFYSFSLKSVKEIVVGLYDQAFRIEVNEEGARGTFTFLTRHASKTAQFLEAYCSVVGVGEEKSSLDMRRRTSFVSGDSTSSIVYPDESKINALKTQLTAQDLCPINDRENLISYCIVYMFDEEQNQEEFLYATDIPVTNIKSLILTNFRLFICDEDYVHWPPTSFVRSLPTTPEWVVDDEIAVSDLIGVDLWENADYKHTLAGNYGMTLTFDNPVTESTESLSKENNTSSWKIIFGSLSEREQSVRSLSCLWKNQFDQDLSVTYTKVASMKPLMNADTVSESGSVAANGKKGHTRVPSGNLSFPITGPIDHPEMLMALNPVRQKTYFIDNIAQFEDEANKGLRFLVCSGCISYLHPEKEATVVTVISYAQIYLVVSEAERHLIGAKKSIIDGSGGTPLWLVSIDYDNLQQVVVGLFDQFVRIEGGTPATTFTLIIRDHEKTNDFLNNLSEVLLAQKPENCPRETRGETMQHHIYKLYCKEDEESGATAATSEFIHPNSEVKIVYPSDESLDKLKENIYEFISITCEWHTDKDFGVLLYLLVSAETEETVLPCTFIVSENFVALLKEDYVNYPLPMFVKELPETAQYKPADARLIAAIVRIEFQDLTNGTFSIVFNRAGVEPSCYEQRFRAASVELDVCLVTDINTDSSVQEEQGVLVWNLRTQSFNEREKIFNILSKMWAVCYSGKTLPIVKRKNTNAGNYY